MIITDQERLRYKSLARDLLSVHLANHMGLVSLDYAKKTYADGEIGDGWIAVAMGFEKTLTQIGV